MTSLLSTFTVNVPYRHIPQNVLFSPRDVTFSATSTCMIRKISLYKILISSRVKFVNKSFLLLHCINSSIASASLIVSWILIFNSAVDVDNDDDGGDDTFVFVFVFDVLVADTAAVSIDMDGCMVL